MPEKILVLLLTSLQPSAEKQVVESVISAGKAWDTYGLAFEGGKSLK